MSSTRRRRRAVVFNGTGPAPAAATPERYRRRHPAHRAAVGLGAGHGGRARDDAPAGGRLPWRDLFARGDRVCPRRLWRHPPYAISPEIVDARADRRSAATFLPALRPPLALRSSSRPRADARRDRRRGRRDILSRAGWRGGWRAALADAGSLVSAADLEAFEAEQQEPIAIDYRGFTVLEAPPNSTGFVLLEELKILEHFDLAAMGLLIGRCGPRHGRGEKARLRRPRALGRRPALARGAARGAAVRRLRRAARRPGSTCSARRRPAPCADAAGDTTYFCTADGEGNAVSGVQSINSGFGSGVMAGDTGILLNNRMSLLAPRAGPSQPAAARPAGAPHDEPADGAQGRRSCGASSARPAPTTRCRSICRC